MILHNFKICLGISLETLHRRSTHPSEYLFKINTYKLLLIPVMKLDINLWSYSWNKSSIFTIHRFVVILLCRNEIEHCSCSRLNCIWATVSSITCISFVFDLVFCNIITILILIMEKKHVRFETAFHLY